MNLYGDIDLDQIELIHELTKTLLAIATCGLSEDPKELGDDLTAIKHEARKALELAGYDFEMLMGGKHHGMVTGNFEA